MKARKWILGVAALTVAVVLFSGCFGTAGNQGTGNSAAQSVRPPASEGPSYAEVQQGETIVGSGMEVTIKYAELVYEVPLHESSGGMFASPKTAADGKVYIDLCVDIKNLQQKSISEGDLIKVEADYNGGYTYRGTEYIERASMGLEMTGGVFGGFLSIDPLETIELRYLIDCPAEVDTNTDAPLFLIITVEGVKYQFVMR